MFGKIFSDNIFKYAKMFKSIGFSHGPYFFLNYQFDNNFVVFEGTVFKLIETPCTFRSNSYA